MKKLDSIGCKLLEDLIKNSSRSDRWLASDEKLSTYYNKRKKLKKTSSKDTLYAR